MQKFSAIRRSGFRGTGFPVMGALGLPPPFVPMPGGPTTLFNGTKIWSVLPTPAEPQPSALTQPGEQPSDRRGVPLATPGRRHLSVVQFRPRPASPSTPAAQTAAARAFHRLVPRYQCGVDAQPHTPGVFWRMRLPARPRSVDHGSRACTSAQSAPTLAIRRSVSASAAPIPAGTSAALGTWVPVSAT